MVPPVRFLEQLMPAAHQGGASVRAALPSRFAPQSFEIESKESPAVRTRDDAGSRDEPRVAPPQQSKPSNDESTRSTQRSPAERGVGDPVVAHAAPVPVRADARQKPADSSAARPLPSPDTPTPALAPTLQRAADVSAPRKRERAAVGDASAVVNASPTSNKAPVNAIGRPPLREHVREQRINPPPVQQPTIVQVTIDRIDVRAPAANATPERTASKPRNASFKSLGDYLRQRDGASGGAS